MLHRIRTYTTASPSKFVIQTRCEKWVIPQNCELLKLLITQQNLHADDLVFLSEKHGHCFIRRLFLLALEDEHKNSSPSSLANFARELASKN